jgi:hypothetical protein
VEAGTGYIRVKTKDGWRREHVVLMEKKIGRKLNNNEQVHHKNGDVQDNKLKNLIVVSNALHHEIHYEESGLKKYNDLLKDRENRQF